MANDHKILNWLVNTAAGFTADAQVLPANWAALESDTGLIKYGDGSTAWADLAYSTQAVANNAKVRAATTANITIATALNNGDTLDGLTLATGDLVLVKNQTSAAQNGIYVVGATPARAANFNTFNEHVGVIVTVAAGTANADKVFLGTANAGGTLDTTDITFADFGLVVGAGFTSTATAAGTTTLTVASNEIQEFTGSTTQTVVLPVVTTLPRTGWKYHIINNSTGALTVNSSGSNLVQTIPAGCEAIISCVLLTGTSAASWNSTFVPASTSAGALDAPTINSPVLVTPTLGAASATSIANGAGAVGTPSFTFTGQTDMGLYKISGTQMGMAIGGALVALAGTNGLSADSFRHRVNLGTTPVGTVSIAEFGDGRDVTTVLTLTNFIVGALAGAGAALGIGNIVYAYPAGQHLELVNSFSALVLTAAGTAVATDTGLGSVVASGAVSVLSGTGTFEDRLTGQTINTAAGGGAAVSALTAATAGIGTGIALNVAGSVKNVFLNSAGTWNADNTGNLTATGTIVLKWTVM